MLLQKMSAPQHPNEDSPIIEIFKSLIRDEPNRQMVLTTAQLINILQKEFAMDTKIVHRFELEVYTNVLKRYLKNWPEWDNFERAFLTMQADVDKEGIALLLTEKHLMIKQYLSRVLNIAHEMASDKLKEIIERERNSVGCVVMEINGTAQQLRTLFLDQPVRGNIFNCKNGISSDHSAERMMFDSVVNWIGVEMEIILKCDDKLITYRRHNCHKLTHTLVNKKLGQPTSKDSGMLPDTAVKLKKRTVCKLPINKLDVLIKQALNFDTKWISVNDVLEKALVDELVYLPEELRVPCEIQRCLSDGKYFRHFVQEVEGERSDKYDLQLEEIISPTCLYSFSVSNTKYACNSDLKFSCTSCHLRFAGDDVVYDILKHFSDVHASERDWTCFRCGKAFTMIALTRASWLHCCTDDV